MRRAIQDATACREALLRLPKLGLGELRQRWRALYKADAHPRISVASCCCELSHIGCRRSLSAAFARSGSVSSTKLHGSSSKREQRSRLVAPS